MGFLSEVIVLRLSDKETFIGNSWAREDGSFEAFWYEKGGQRVTKFFDAKGIQTGAWKEYKLRFRG